MATLVFDQEYRIARDTHSDINENIEYTTAEMDFLSNGFKLRNSGGGSNGSSETFVYMAWAEQPGLTPFHTFPSAR